MARKYLDATGLTALWSKIKGLFNGLATVATTGSYNDLTNKPTVAEIDDTSTAADKAWSASKIGTDLGGKVSRSGDIMTGALIAPAFTASANGSPTINSQSTDVDASKADNNVSSDHYPAWMASDKYGRILTRMECVASSNGNIGSFWHVRNYNTSGSQTGQKGIKMSMAKDGTLTYTVDDNSKFRTALGLATVASSGSYNDLSNKPTIPDISGKVDKTGDPTIFKTSDMPQGAANLSASATTHRVTVYRNGLSIPYQADNPNDGGILRVRGTSESSCILELGTWDDSGSGETIQFNYYPTTSQITPTYSVSVPKANGTIALTSQLPSTQSVGFTRSHASVSYQEGLVCNRFGNVVTFAGYFSCGATIGANTTLYSGLPKPAGGKAIYFTWSGYDFYLHATDGSIRTNGQIVSRTYVGTFTYVCA